MCKIYTLRKPMTGERGVALNGKLLNIFVSTDADKKVLFRDAVSGDNLWITTQVAIPPHPTSDGIKFVTRSGANYDLINVETLIPTKVTEAKNEDSKQLAVTDAVAKEATICSLTEKEARELSINIFDMFDKKLLDSFDAKGIKTVGDAVDYLKNKQKFSAVLAKAVTFTKRTTTEKMIVNCLRAVGYEIVASYPDDYDWESDDGDCLWTVRGFTQLNSKSSSDFKVIFELYEYKPIHYGNGYRKTTFKFNRDLTEKEFCQYLFENEFPIHEAEGWWDDHSKIEGKGQKWTYTWVLAYTD